MNSINKCLANTPLSTFLRDFSSQERRLLNNTVVSLSARSPIALVSISGPGAQDLFELKYIFPTIPTDTDTPERNLESRSVQDSTLSERDHSSRSIYHAFGKATNQKCRATPPIRPNRC